MKSIAVRIHAYAELVALCLHRVPRSNGHVKAHASKQNLYWWTNQNLFWQSAPISALARVRHADQKKQANHHRFPSADWLCRCISICTINALEGSSAVSSFFNYFPANQRLKTIPFIMFITTLDLHSETESETAQMWRQWRWDLDMHHSKFKWYEKKKAGSGPT